MVTKEEALNYHQMGRKGKIEVVPTKPCLTQRDLSLAYTPGVAVPCLEIHRDPELVNAYTARGNLVAVISNGTAVLGLGNIGPKAGKPVMEGKGVLFKRFADIDVFDIEVDELDPDKLIDIVASLEPTFGGINLEDIKAPECFYIEEKLRERMHIPVFHDDQHGTAIITAAGMLNALELVNKKIDRVKMVFSGAGAASVACANLLILMGAKVENIWMTDTKGVITTRREKIEKYRGKFAKDSDAKTLADIMINADVFVGLSVKGAVTQEMVKTMAKDAIIFAMANPDPEIMPEDVFAVRKDVIMATGRSDYPNQVNNVLGFPFIFRGALDVGATQINEEMKVAAAKALAALAREDVPDRVCRAYGLDHISFGPDYIIPKPLDERVLLWVAPAIAQAAMDSGVAKCPLKNLDSYREELEIHLGGSREIIRPIINQAKTELMKIAFVEGANADVLKAIRIIQDEKICQPILIGNEKSIHAVADEMGLHLNWGKLKIVDPVLSSKLPKYTGEFYKLRQRKGINMLEAQKMMRWNNYFATMMLHSGDIDGMIAGIDTAYNIALKPSLQIIGVQKGFKRIAGMYVMAFKSGIYFFSDTTVNIDPTADDLAEIAISTADFAKQYFSQDPRIAMLSFSNFGAKDHPMSQKVRDAVSIVRLRRPDLIVDGEMQADTAVAAAILEKEYPFNKLGHAANVLIFPDLGSANISYKLCARLGGGVAIGPLLIGTKKPVNILQQGASERDVVNIAAITAVEAQEFRKK